MTYHYPVLGTASDWSCREEIYFNLQAKKIHPIINPLDTPPPLPPSEFDLL